MTWWWPIIIGSQWTGLKHYWPQTMPNKINSWSSAISVINNKSAHTVLHRGPGITSSRLSSEASLQIDPVPPEEANKKLSASERSRRGYRIVSVINYSSHMCNILEESYFKRGKRRWVLTPSMFSLPPPLEPLLLNLNLPSQQQPGCVTYCLTPTLSHLNCWSDPDT